MFSIVSTRVTITVGSILCAIVVAGCASVGGSSGEPAPSPDNTPVVLEPTEEPAPEKIVPSPLFELGCEDVVPIDRVIELYGPEVAALEARPTFVDTTRVRTAAALADGALVCDWARPGDSLPTMTLMATVATADEYAVGYAGYDLFPRPTPPLPVLDGARATCIESYPAGTLMLSCGWSVFSDGVWIVASFTDIPNSEVVEPAVRQNPDTSSNPVTANPDGVAAKILIDAASSLAASALPRSSPVSPDISCDELKDGLASPSVFGTLISAYDLGTMEAEDLGTSTASMGGLLPILGVQRQGWTDCHFVYPSDLDGSIAVIFAPGASWILDSPPHPLDQRVDLPSGDGFTRTTLDEGGETSSVALRRGDDLLFVHARIAAIDALEQYARSVAESIDELLR